MPLRQRAEPSATPIVTESIAGVDTEDLDQHPSKSWCRADNKWESLPQLKLRRHPSGVACLELSMFYAYVQSRPDSCETLTVRFIKG